MRLPLPKQLDRNGGVVSLSLVAPTVRASATDDTAQTLTLNGAEFRVSGDWTVAEAKSGESDLALLRRGSDLRVLAGDREGRVREIVGYSAAERRDILTLRFGEEAPKTTEDREIDRLTALRADAITPANGTDDAEVDRLLKLADTLEGSSPDDAEADRLAKLAEGL